MSTTSNVMAIARREIVVRTRTRSFAMATLLLVIGVLVIALLPVIIAKVDSTSRTRIAVVAPDQATAARASTLISSLLNTTPGDTAAPGAAQPDYEVTIAPDLDTARRQVLSEGYTGALAIDRQADKSLTFSYYTNEPATGRTPSLLRQAANAIAVGDRLDRLAIAPGDQATLFAPASFSVAWPDPQRTDPIKDVTTSVGQDLLAFGMTLLIFMIVVMYGNWVAMSVVEEKSSRVMEVVLNAATPFQLLAGKVFGVGAVAFLQYAAVVGTGVVALLLEPMVASAVLGTSAPSMELPQGLTPGLLLVFGVYGVLGFLLYASLFAAAGSLVSRQEDVNAVVMPMTLLSTAGYIVGVYASTGILDIRAGWIIALTQVPFLSPFMILGRVATGVAQPWELGLSMLLLAVTILGAIWVAARIYAVGVLLYGQRPGPRAIWRLLCEGM